MKNSAARHQPTFPGNLFYRTPVLALSLFLLPAAVPSAARAQGADQSAVLCEDIKKPFFTVTCGDNGLCIAERARRESQAASFWLPKPAGVKRVFVVGESVANLLRTPEDAGLKNGKIEVINCGVGGYESYRIKDVFRQVLKYRPDLIVVLSGNNEGAGYNCPGTAFAVQNRLKRLLERYYSLRLDPPRARIEASIKLQEMRLEAMAGFARSRKIPLIFCALPANLRGMPPAGALPLGSPAFAAGLAEFEKGRLKAAERFFRESMRKDTGDLFSAYYLAKTLEGLGLFTEARQAYLDIVERDKNQDRASVSRNAMIRGVAARAGAGFCDLDAAFKTASGNGIPGLTQFSDAMHWHPKYNELVWSEIAGTARSLGLAWFILPRPAVNLDVLTPEELRRSFSYAVTYLDNTAYGLLTAEEEAAGTPVERAIEELAFLESKSPGLLEKTGKSAEKFSAYFIVNFWSRRTAGRLEELRPAFLANLAEMERRRGNYRKTLELLKSAEAAGPGKPYYRLTKALALSGLGRTAEARKELEPLYDIPTLRLKALAAAEARGLGPAAAVGREGPGPAGND